MYSLNQVKKLVSCGRDPARSLPLWRGFLLIPLILVCFTVAPQTRAVTPAPDGCYPLFNTAEGCNSLLAITTGAGNTGLGWFAAFTTTSQNFNTGVGAGALALNSADSNTAVGAAALILNIDGRENTAVGAGALVNDKGDTSDNGAFNDAVGAFALNANVTGFSNNALGNAALNANINGAQNTAVGDEALEVNDSTGHGTGNFNTAVGALSLLNNVDGSQNTGVGNGVGPNIANGFGNTYVGDSVGSLAGTPDESNVIRIGDLSNGNGAGSLACFIGGIFNNIQPVGGDIVAVTLNTLTDQLGIDPAFGRAGSPAAVPHRNAPQPRMRPQAHHQAMLNDKVEKLEATVAQQQATVAQQQATVAQQQKQIETLTAQLKEQAAQIQNVSAQLEMVRPAPRVVENR